MEYQSYQGILITIYDGHMQQGFTQIQMIVIILTMAVLLITLQRNVMGVKSHCCNQKMPRFLKTLDQPTDNDIEPRVCNDAGYPSEDIPLTEIELFVQ